MYTFELIDDADRVRNTIEAVTILDAIEWFFFGKDYIVTVATADCATVIALGRKFIVRKTDKGGRFL